MATLIGQDTGVVNYPSDTTIYNGDREWYQPIISSGAGDITSLELNVADMWTSSSFKLTLRNSSGVLLAVSAPTSGTGKVSAAITSTAITDATQYWIGFIADTGYIKPRSTGVTYDDVRVDLTSTYASPAASVDVVQAENAKDRFAMNAQGTAGAPSGPTVDSITSPIIGTDTVTIVLSEAAPTVDTITFTVGTVTQSQSYTTGDDTTFTISAVTRNLLPPIGTVTVELKAGASVITSTTSTLQQAAGYSATIGVGVDDGLAVPHTGTLADGDIVLLSDDPNTSIDAAFTDITQTVRTAFTAQVWSAGTETWGDVVIYPVSGGSSGSANNAGIGTGRTIWGGGFFA